MSDEKKEGRINIDDLPQPSRTLTPEEAKEVKGGRKMGDVISQASRAIRRRIMLPELD